MSGKYKDWVDSLIKENVYPWTLEASRGIKLFKVSKPYLYKNNYYNEVTYHVWVNDDWVYAGRDYKEAYNIYSSKRNELEEHRNG